MSIRYWIEDDRIHFAGETASGTFTEHDTEGLYSNYQAWLAEGNTPEVWNPDTTTESVES